MARKFAQMKGNEVVGFASFANDVFTEEMEEDDPRIVAFKEKQEAKPTPPSAIQPIPASVNTVKELRDALNETRAYLRGDG